MERDFGDPSRGEALGFWRSAGPCPAVCPWGGAGAAGPGGSFAPRAPQPVPAAARGSRGGGGAAPHNFKGESVFSSSPTPHQRIKKIKTQPRKRFCVPSPVSHVGQKPPEALSLPSGAPQSHTPPSPAPRLLQSRFLFTHHLLFIGKSEWSHFVAYASRLYL